MLIVLVGAGAIAFLLISGRLNYSQQVVKTCFNDAGGLRAGASVRISGVEVGAVRSVRANPQSEDCLAEVDMVIATPYEIRIPNDSVAEVQRGGLLGPPLVVIDVSHAHGPPIEKQAYLKSKQN